MRTHLLVDRGYVENNNPMDPRKALESEYAKIRRKSARYGSASLIATKNDGKKRGVDGV